MGNCQAVDAVALVIQHQSGKIERLYWSVTASEVMKMNPGHYVSLIIPLPISEEDENKNREEITKTVKFTRVKLLKPSDTLVLGKAYRLVTTQEVTRVLRAKRNAKLKNKHQELNEISKTNSEEEAGNAKMERINQKLGNYKDQIKTTGIEYNSFEDMETVRVVTPNGGSLCNFFNHQKIKFPAPICKKYAAKLYIVPENTDKTWVSREQKKL